MAVTGKTSIPIVPGVRKVSPYVVGRPGASSQTNPAGCPIVITSGYAASVTGIVSNNIFGFAAEAGKNTATDGAGELAIYRAQQGRDFVGVLDGTWGTVYHQASCALSVNSAGVVLLKVGTAVSASSCAIMQEPTNGFTVGDVNPIVSFVLLDAAIQP